MQIVYVNWIARDVVVEIVRFAVSDAATDAAACHPDGEAAWMVVPSVIRLREATLTVDRAAELTAPNHDRVLEQSALREVLNQCR